jgi:hypothetical protein
MDFLSIHGLMGKLQAHEERVNKIQKDVSAQTFFFFKTRWFWIFPKKKRKIWKRRSKQPQ